MCIKRHIFCKLNYLLIKLKLPRVCASQRRVHESACEMVGIDTTDDKLASSVLIFVEP